jgi:hypothetical protein
MDFIVKCKSVAQTSIRSQTCAREQWSFLRLREGVSELWIEDKEGKVIIDGEEIRRRWRERG